MRSQSARSIALLAIVVSPGRASALGRAPQHVVDEFDREAILADEQRRKVIADQRIDDIAPAAGAEAESAVLSGDLDPDFLVRLAGNASLCARKFGIAIDRMCALNELVVARPTGWCLRLRRTAGSACKFRRILFSSKLALALQ